MKKKTRNLLLMLLVLLVVSGGIAAIVLLAPETPSDEQDSLEDSSNISTELLSVEDSQVNSLTIVNENGEFSFVPYQDDTDTLAFTLEGFESYNLNTTNTSADVRAAIVLTATRTLEGESDLEKFGLSGDGRAKVTLDTSEGTYEYLIGKASAESSGNYVLIDGEIYIVSGLPSRFFEPVFSYFSKDIYAVAQRTSGDNDLEDTSSYILFNVKLRNSKTGDRQVEITRDESIISGYVMTAPVRGVSGTTALSNLVEKLQLLSASQVVDAGITDEKLALYGLDNPAAQIEFKMNSETHVLTASAPDSDKNCYIIADDNDVVYQISQDSLSEWTTVSIMDLRADYIWLAGIFDVQTLTITADGKENIYNITRTVNEESSTEDSTSYDLTIASSDGRDIVYESYQKLFKELLAIPVLSPDEEECEDTAAFEITYEYFSGKSDTISFYPSRESDKYVSYLNGHLSGIVRASSIESAISSLEQFG